MDSHKLIRSGVANDAGKLRPTLQHCLEAALSIADSKFAFPQGAVNHYFFHGVLVEKTVHSDWVRLTTAVSS